MKLTISHEPVLTHEERFNLQMTYQQLYDLRSMMYLLNNPNISDKHVSTWYSDVVSSIIKATDNYGAVAPYER